ncbi:M56 family metallopeptidase [Segatella hominis]|uniref:M56 family metallopeptidase n=1 Tax=Segatella hominis TaxID=2518605 RepID=UPI001C45FEBA|nr:M56 family metallopeptidase [Segatella hominis]WOZ81714.1 M56 family metallopeptidase [Segatella hominis]
MAIYLIKINVALMLLYGFYRLTVSRDTFFGLRRLTLWLIYAVALMVPAFNLEYWVRDTPTMVSMANVYADTFYPVVVVKAQASSITWMDMLLGIYWVGVAVLSLRLVWQLFSIIRLVVISRKQEVEGITVHLLKGEGSPFSFFRWVFMYPSTLEGKQLHEVMVHECTHVSGLHSLDTLFSELFSIVCWFNPFAWLMKQEVRMNLEYLADESVLSDGNARKSYQYHLLGLAYRQPKDSAQIANNFNLLPLKKRIKMMNKRRTSEIGKAKYLLFAPLAGALLMVSNIESVAREIGEQIPEVAEVQQKAEQALNTDVAVANPMAKEAIEVMNPAESEEMDAEKAAEAELSKAEEAKTEEADKVAEVKAEAKAEVKVKNKAQADTTKKKKSWDCIPETMPYFPGGRELLLKYLAVNIKYPASAVKAKKQGRVIVTFIVQKDGSVTHAKIAKSIDPELDAEALRVVRGMPKWIPGTQLGKPVNVKYTLPVKFSLQKDATLGKKK